MRIRFVVAALAMLLLQVTATRAEVIAWFDSDGVKIRYVSAGKGEPVILLHGFSGSADGAWINPGTFKAIEDAGYQVIAIDQRGHGQSDKPHDPQSYGVQMADDVGRLLDHLNIRQAHIVGYSMGGKIANTFRARHPERLISLTLGGYGWPWKARDTSYEKALANMGRRQILPGNDISALAACSVLSNELVPAAEDLRANNIPVLSLVGTEDEVVPRSEVESLRQTMSAVQSVDMPGTHAGAEAALYKSQFGREIITFLGQHSQAAH